MAGISSKAAGKLDYKRNKFQNQEYNDDLGVNVYEFRWRSNDPQTGRFWQNDPLSNKYVYNSTYAFSENKVTSHVELEGLEAVEFFINIFKDNQGNWQNGSGSSIAVNNPYNLGDGNLYHVKINDSKTIETIDFYVPATSKSESWLEEKWNEFENWIKGPQVMVFGGGNSFSDSPGSKPDYTKPIFTINLSDATDLIDLLTLNVIPDPKDIKAEKAIDILKKYLDKNQEDRNKPKAPTPFVICNFCKSQGGSGIIPASDTPRHKGSFKRNIEQKASSELDSSGQLSGTKK